MSKPKYLPTPGPWAIPNTDDLIDKPTLVWSRGGLVCEVKHNNREANARLIAAAPDLLEALHIALTMISADFNTRIQQPVEAQANSVVMKVMEDAIAKAEGRAE